MDSKDTGRGVGGSRDGGRSGGHGDGRSSWGWSGSGHGWLGVSTQGLAGELFVKHFVHPA